MKICFIIPVRNRKEHTQQILSQIENQAVKVNGANFKVIVVDDGSTDGTREMIGQKFPQVHLLEGDGNLWWTGAISKGMKYALKDKETDYLVWLNDDIELAEDFLEKLQNICQDRLNRSSTEIIGGIVRDKTYPNWVVFSGVIEGQPIRSLDNFGNQEEILVDTLNGNIILIPRLVIDKIGFPDEIRFPHYGGDYEFVCRAKAAGFQVILSQQLQAKTDYQIEDVIRYMPPWMQWRLATGLSQKIKILSGLTDRKSNYNIAHMVNSMYRHEQNIPQRKYWILYIKKIWQLSAINLVPDFLIKPKLSEYFKQQNFPPAVINTIMNCPQRIA